MGGKYFIGDTEVAKLSSANGQLARAELKVKNHFSIFMAPGLKIGNESLLYAKVSYDHMKGAVETNLWNGTYSLSGLGYGAGVKVALSTNIYAMVEMMRITYRGQDIGVASTTSGTTLGTVGLGYTF